ncbi:sphingosine N-acyltransferase Lag1 [Schizosaccharomyces cryophilus OY26]|uniref:Sphingosine N-acyltransferase Lag1 n=1 Tax=Schizosaccharomyces cryophilus (strain OY26 / ATCC MYA-4695 / CBS 11777 / NBRC 106824 / NRRL Y48691) TaxID=653667 RepID=S9XAM6_SCHCR|nr:sphingosine N-acyltransferase Lag1 [Schizosaccharomyces cryophilus OY26]EPY50811.1 sphingosine N-acyltransferase Lag1 [Schizosaccharomyces cryophilus OY26]
MSKKAFKGKENKRIRPSPIGHESIKDISHTGTSNNFFSCSLEDPRNFVTKDGRKLVQAPLFLVLWQKEISLALISLCIFLYLLPPTRPYAEPFMFLSYKESSDVYGKGPKDFLFSFYWLVIFTAIRSIVMDYCFRPFILSWGIRKRKVVVRFCEQGYCFLYYFVFWLLGFYIYRNSGYWDHEEQLFEHYPQYYMSTLFKFYYLAQFGFWLQQIYVLHVEQRRADHWQMFAHHIVTCSLIFLSYSFNFLRVGNAILYIFDLSDYILSGSKMIKYLGFGKICDYLFGLFMVSWIYSRHYLYYRILKVVITSAPNIIGGFNVDFSKGYIFNEQIYYAFVFLLFSLQLLIYIWFGMIVKVAYRVFSGAGAVDSRSDDEEEPDEDSKKQ